jgi:flagellar biosynthesis protein FlhF
VAEAACRLLPNSPCRDGLPGKRVVTFVGPTGVGKTTAAAKLGARLVLERKKSVLLMTTDTCRIGAIEQLRTYAGLMGLPFRLVNQVADLPKMLEESSQRDYVLIDTAGRGQRDLASVRELLEFLRQAPEIERHLVLSATTKSVDMHEIVDRFAVCNPDHLLFTKLDETSTFGPLFNELVRTQKPLSYFTDGQRVPEDLHVAQKDQIVDILLNTH